MDRRAMMKRLRRLRKARAAQGDRVREGGLEEALSAPLPKGRHMFRSAASKVMRVGRATVFMVGLAVMLALVFGVSSMALGTNGQSFLLGKKNVASAISTLVKQGSGPALKLTVGAGQAPLAVNSKARVANLNAASAGRADSAARADSATNAHNAGKLDGLGWQPETWRELNPAGGAAPAFFDISGPSSATWGTANNAECHGATSAWTNYDADHTSAAFYKDQQGVVHLKGLVKGGVTGTPNFWSGCPIFFLPEGYRPAKSSNFSVVTSDGANPGRVEIRANGGVYCLNGGNAFISLDGIIFREGQ